MLKKIIGLFIICLVVLLSCVAIVRINDESDKNVLKHITVAEVAHSVFYAPQYVAHGLGFFKEEGLDVDIVLTSGADNVMAAVLSGDADIGFSGSEATIYVYNGGEEDYVMTFAGLTQKDGSFLVSRKKYDNFTLDDLKGKSVIGGRLGNLIRSYNTGLFFKALCLVLNSFKHSSGFLIFNLIVISLLLLITILSIILANKNLLGFLILKYS